VVKWFGWILFEGMKRGKENAVAHRNRAGHARTLPLGLSANNAVTVLRSPSSGSEASGCSGGMGTLPRESAEVEALVPTAACPSRATAQCEQNFALGAFGWAHRGHARLSCVAH
jgi:hypothetical protein